MTTITNVEDLRLAAKRRLPKSVFEFIDTGSYDEVTLRRNMSDFRDVQLRQRVLIDVENRSTKTTLLGQAAAIPAAISSVGLSGLLCPDGKGEIYAARAAQAAGIPFAMSVMSVASMEEIRDATGAPFWFQVYMLRDRGAVQTLVDRALAAGCSTLVVTVCSQVPGQRHSDVKNGLSLPPRIGFHNFLEFALKPRWALSALARRPARLGNLMGLAPLQDLGALLRWSGEQLDTSLNWRDIAWLRERWPRKLLVKGILDCDDAREAVNAGADAISVSNHGGTQLDGAPSAIAALPGIVEAVDGRLEVLLDSGVRSGQDIFKALAHGARGCLLGRAHLYALGAMGEQGVATAIQLISRELDVTMAKTGVRTVDEISTDVLWPPPAPRPANARSRKS